MTQFRPDTPVASDCILDLLGPLPVNSEENLQIMDFLRQIYQAMQKYADDYLQELEREA